MSETHTCSLRMEWDDRRDTWERRQNTGNHLCCSWCGSLHPEEFLSLVQRGAQLDPTDKSYKAYVHHEEHQLKFYFEHLNAEQAKLLAQFHTENRINFAFPGRFYVKPLFMSVEDATAFSFSAVVKVEGPVPDGQVVTLIDPVYERLIQEIRKSPEFIHKITPRQWEELIAAAYDNEGFDEVILTPRSGDLGRDVIAIKKGFGSIKFIEQVKAYSPDHIVKADEVRALLGVLHADQDASKGIFTTTSSFAPGIRSDRLIKPFLPYRLELVDKPRLIERLIRLERPHRKS